MRTIKYMCIVLFSDHSPRVTIDVPECKVTHCALFVCIVLNTKLVMNKIWIAEP